MKLSINPSVTVPRNITAESLALAFWYDSHPAVRTQGILAAGSFELLVGTQRDPDSPQATTARESFADIAPAVHGEFWNALACDCRMH